MALRSGCARSVCFLFAAVFLIFSAGAQPQVPVASIAAAGLPERLSDLEFWRLIEEFSEPNGYFHSDNLLSNEMWMQHVIPDLIRRTQPGGAYLGVGPEQNFTYIAALRPGIAFITDIRRGNLHTQLMYKALFELSAGRADFVARLFTRAVPEGLDGKSSVGEIIEKLIGVATGDEAAYKNNLQEITDLLVKKHRFPLSSEDQAGIDYVYRNFFRFGPGLNYRSSGQSFGGRGGNFATYADLMTLTDRSGANRSYLASDENFKTVKDLEQNMIAMELKIEYVEMSFRGSDSLFLARAACRLAVRPKRCSRMSQFDIRGSIHEASYSVHKLRYRMHSSTSGTLAPCLAAAPMGHTALPQTTADPELLAAIQKIKAIDNHSHALPARKPNPSEVDRPDPLGKTPFEYPVRLRVTNPEYVEAWRALYG